MTQLTDPQQQVVDCINELNKEHGVASALYVAARLSLTQTYVNQLCQSLKQMGVVTWEPNVPSLRVVTQPVAPEPSEETADHDAETEAQADADDEKERQRKLRNEALARGRETAARNRAAAKAASGQE